MDSGGMILGAVVIFAFWSGVGWLVRRGGAAVRSVLPNAHLRGVSSNPVAVGQFRPPGEILCQQTGWHTHGDEIFNRYGYQGILDSGGELTMEINCALYRGFALDLVGPIQSNFSFLLSPGLLENEGYVMGIVSSESTDKSTGWMTMRAGPTTDRKMIAQIEGAPKCASALNLMLSGEDCVVELRLNPKESIARLRFPVGMGFAARYRELARRIPATTLDMIADLAEANGTRDAKAADELARAQVIYTKIIKDPRNVLSSTPVATGRGPQQRQKGPGRAPKPAANSPGVTRKRNSVGSPMLGAMAKLSADELDFIRSQGILVSELFDATGLRRARYAEAMSETGQPFACGTKPCAKGHSLRTRAGHCIQCDTSRIAFALRHRRSGHVYIAESASALLLKVGSTIDLSDRERSLRDHGYGGAHDWKIRLSAQVEKAGSVEFASQSKLREYSVEGSYRRDGRDQSCYELFSCSYDQAREAVISSLPPGTVVRDKRGGRSPT